MKIKMVSMDEVAEFAHVRMQDKVIFILFGGERLSSCDEGVAAFVDGKMVGVATISPESMARDNSTRIVGLYIDPAYRRKGHGVALMATAVDRCRVRGFFRVRVDVMSTGAKKAVKRLPAEMRAMLMVVDHGPELDRMS